MTKNNNQSLKRTVKNTIKLVVFTLVVYMIYRTIAKSADEFASADIRLSAISIPLLACSAILYSVGLAFFSLFWHRALITLRQSPTLIESIGSYFISQLGKYVPGKALVVVIRSERVASDRTQVAPAVAAVFIETLGMMACGAVLAGLLLLFSEYRTTQPQFLQLSLALAVAAGVPSSPPIFREIIRRLSRKRLKTDLEQAVSHVTLRAMVPCWALALIGWLFLGGSLLTIIMALPSDVLVTPVNFSHYMVVTACVALSVVAGFISLIPGGAGVREFIVMTLLSATYGVVAATIAAILMRVIWLASEVINALFSYILMKRARVQ